MPVPKRKTSKGRRNRRRAHHALAATMIVKCPKCLEPKLPHRMCHNCGYYLRSSPQKKSARSKT